MDSKELCRKCCFPVQDYVTNMTYDKHGKYVRCPKCVEFERKMDHHRTEWNQRVVWHVKRLDPELQDYYKYDLQHGDLRAYLYSMREGGKSPAEAVRAWRHKIMYLDAAAGRKVNSPSSTRSKSSHYQTKYEMVPQRQYRQPEEMPLVFSQPREVITQPEMTVIYAPPTKVIMVADELPRTYYSDGDTVSDTSSSDEDSSRNDARGQISGVVRDRHGRYAVVVKDIRGRKVKGRSALAFFAT